MSTSASLSRVATRLVDELEERIGGELTTRTVLGETPIPHSTTVKSTPDEVVYPSIRSERGIASSSCMRASDTAPCIIGFKFDLLIKRKGSLLDLKGSSS